MSRAKGTGSIYKLSKTSRYWWVAYVSDGKRRCESSKSTVKKVAQDLLTSRLGDVGRGIVVTPKVGRITIGRGLAAVMNDLTMNGRKSAAETQRRIDRHLLRHFERERRMNSITTADIETYKSARLMEGVAPATVNRELAALRRAFRLAVRGGELVQMPHIGMLQEHNVRKGFFERDQLDAIFKHLPVELHAPLTFAFITGWRLKSEVLKLTVSQLDLDAGMVRLEVGTTKSGEGRSFFVTKELRTLLQGQLDSIADLKKQGVVTPFLFHWADGSQIKDFRKTWERARDAAGFPGKLLHDFRRTAVRNLERASIPRSTAMAMVGHKTEAIYRRYAIVDEAMHREAAAKLDAWAEGETVKTEARGQLKAFKRSNG
ncbi:MAG TPA: tyrosine-type recombinase/integrase [Vicinamibacterales bacterium]|nr:tyrosine-type recombinase/integrase [Vicinamibacterales bacterium]